ncbi:hypothetical protein BC829DRAFT_467989 [Chytridium lagenaria]|nr:hypothetical protein BC829DRAFT_467989 [Chytridium lagenaria]
MSSRTTRSQTPKRMFVNDENSAPIEISSSHLLLATIKPILTMPSQSKHLPTKKPVKDASKKPIAKTIPLHDRDDVKPVHPEQPNLIRETPYRAAGEGRRLEWGTMEESVVDEQPAGRTRRGKKAEVRRLPQRLGLLDARGKPIEPSIPNRAPSSTLTHPRVTRWWQQFNIDCWEKPYDHIFSVCCCGASREKAPLPVARGVPGVMWWGVWIMLGSGWKDVFELKCLPRWGVLRLESACFSGVRGWEVYTCGTSAFTDAVTILGTVVDIALREFVLAVTNLDSCTVHAFGSNNWGQLGVVTRTRASPPVIVKAIAVPDPLTEKGKRSGM